MNDDILFERLDRIKFQIENGEFVNNNKQDIYDM